VGAKKEGPWLTTEGGRKGPFERRKEGGRNSGIRTEKKTEERTARGGREIEKKKKKRSVPVWGGRWEGGKGMFSIPRKGEKSGFPPTKMRKGGKKRKKGRMTLAVPQGKRKEGEKKRERTPFVHSQRKEKEKRRGNESLSKNKKINNESSVGWGGEGGGGNPLRTKKKKNNSIVLTGGKKKKKKKSRHLRKKRGKE